MADIIKKAKYLVPIVEEGGVVNDFNNVHFETDGTMITLDDTKTQKLSEMPLLINSANVAIIYGAGAPTSSTVKPAGATIALYIDTESIG